MGDRKVMNSEGGRDELGNEEGEETIIGIYYIKIYFQ